MACFHPMWAVRHPTSINPETGQPVVQIFGYDCPEAFKNSPLLFQVPCGKCMGCRVDRSREWANRCLMELQDHDSAFFITLTYNDIHAPTTWYADPKTGEAHPAYTLCKRDLQLWLKRLRKAFPNDKIRFFACGEYGTQSMRPHYHVIVFGLHLDDLQPFGKSHTGDYYFRSPSLERTWYAATTVPDLSGSGSVSVPPSSMGFVMVSQVTWATCAYVARYVTKKLYGQDAREMYESHNLVPPYLVMSRKPGIGARYYDRNKSEIYAYDQVVLSTDTGGRTFKPPRYFDKKFVLENPEQMAQIKVLRRQVAENSKQAKLAYTGLSESMYNEQAEELFLRKISKLERSAI